MTLLIISCMFTPLIVFFYYQAAINYEFLIIFI